MTLKKVAKKTTPGYTYFAYARMDKGNVKYYWRNPCNDQLLPISTSSLKKWEKILN